MSHIFTATVQPATRYRVPGIDHWFGWAPHSRPRCDKCGRRREARNLRVKTYYDKMDVFCADGCKTK